MKGRHTATLGLLHVKQLSLLSPSVSLRLHTLALCVDTTAPL